MDTVSPSRRPATASGPTADARLARCTGQMTAVLTAAFALSLVHTLYAWVNRLENPDFTVTSPVTWVFYGVAFGMAALCLRQERWAQWVVQVFLVLTLIVAVFVYPQTFEPHQQTVFGWFENDVYVGLLFVAAYLGIVRLRGLTMTA